MDASVSVRRYRCTYREPKLIGDGVAELELGCGRVTLISECDISRVSFIKWHSSTNGRNDTFYVKGRYERGGTLIRLHRLILCFPLLQVDHINRNGLDNRRCNLRLVTQSENNRNRRKYIIARAAS